MTARTQMRPGLRQHPRVASVLRACLVVAACSCSPRKESPSTATSTPARIVSVGGAVTETLFALGAGDRVVGDDTSSLYPEAAVALPHVGYQRTLGAEGILALAPTLVIASGEAGPPPVLEQLRGAGVRVEMVPADSSVAGARDRITKVAALVGRDPGPTLDALDESLARAAAFVGHTTTRPRVLALYARGENTLLVFGRGTAAEAMLRLAGAENAVTAFEGAKPLTSEAVVQAAPDIILLPSRGLESVGGLEALLRLPGLAETPAGRAKRVVTMDDLLLLGFGPRTGQASLELATKLHPDVTPEVAP